MHQFLKELQGSPKVQARIRRDREIEARTIQAIQNLLNDLEPVPGLGKLVFNISVADDEMVAEVGIKREAN